MRACEHLQSGPSPLRVECVFDEQFGFTDCLASCRDCHASYLLEMLDWQGDLRLFRVSRPDPAHSARLLKDLERGSCDIRRAAAEAEQFRLANASGSLLLLMDMTGPRIEAVVEPEPGVRVPRASWRDLPCDGSWIRRVYRPPHTARTPVDQARS